ncbi:MAG: monovalent cation/H+ antiporter subunit D family protein [Puniceicoccaceae bacterium]|nr:MAG: monovalent cation/H+ antiporter subunit D family protein [Puniceicoccaceae bacterium]
MTEQSWLLPAIVASSLGPGILIFFLKEEQVGLRTLLNLFGAVLKVLLVGVALRGFFLGESYEFRYAIAVDLEFYLRVDALALLFSILSSVLWLVTTFYAIGYLKGSPNRRRFFGFFSICVTASTGIALAGNVVTFFIFYEFLTLATYPLVVHQGTKKALEAGRTYLFYTIGGGTVLFVGVVWLFVLAGSVEFGQTELLSNLPGDQQVQLMILFGVLLAGLGVKAALVPLHGWLPAAMVAPAPVSALLHAVAVVKAGVFGIVRIVYDVFGVDLVRDLGMLHPLAVIAALTIIFGSLRAIAQDDLKRRLAYSTVSQLAYISLGIALGGPLAALGALVHLVHQGVMKITLFFCAGIIAETVKVHRISEMNGIGRRLPLTMGAFTVGALGMIGLPPVAGFISKWYLGLGGLEVGYHWVMPLLLLSSLLNAMYFLPILKRAWFCEPDGEWETHRSSRSWETPRMLLFPALITAALSVALGLFAASNWSVVEIALQIVESWFPLK